MSDIETGERDLSEVVQAPARETMTLEAIERGPMNAVTLDLPSDASRELLGAIVDIASDIWERAIEGAIWSLTPTEEASFERLYRQAKERLDEARIQLELAPMWCGEGDEA